MKKIKKTNIELLDDVIAIKSNEISNISNKQLNICHNVFCDLINEFNLNIDISKLKITYKVNNKKLTICYLDREIIYINQEKEEDKYEFNQLHVSSYYIPDSFNIKNLKTNTLDVYSIVDKIINLFVTHNEYFNSKFSFLNHIVDDIESKQHLIQLISYFKQGIDNYNNLVKVDDIFTKGEYESKYAIQISSFNKRWISINKVKFTKNITNTYCVYFYYDNEMLSSSNRVNESTLRDYINMFL